MDLPLRHAVSAALAACLLAAFVSVAKAQDLTERIRVRLTAGGALMVSRDQVDVLGYDGGLTGTGQFGVALQEWLQVHVAVGGAFFPAAGVGGAAGGLAVPSLGLGANTLGDALSLYVHVDLGLGFTGALQRTWLRAASGVDFRVVRAFTLGPVLGYDQVIQHDAPGASTDARFFWIGFSLTLRPALLRDPAVESPQTVVHTEHTVHTEHRQTIREPTVSREVFVEPSPELLALIDQTIPSTKVEVQMLAPVLFHFDSDRLQPIGVAMLHEVAHELTSRPELELIEIIGAADTRGDAAYNVELSERRARRVYDWLTDHGVAPERLQVATQGASNPVETGEAEAHHEQNRRVVFRVLRVSETP